MVFCLLIYRILLNSFLCYTVHTLLYYKIFSNLIFYNSLLISISSSLDTTIPNAAPMASFPSPFVHCIPGSFIERRKPSLNSLSRKPLFTLIRVEYLYEALKKDINKNRNIFWLLFNSAVYIKISLQSILTKIKIIFVFLTLWNIVINTLILYLCALEYFSWIRDVFQISLVLGLLRHHNHHSQPNSTVQ